MEEPNSAPWAVFPLSFFGRPPILGRARSSPFRSKLAPPASRDPPPLVPPLARREGVLPGLDAAEGPGQGLGPGGAAAGERQAAASHGARRVGGGWTRMDVQTERADGRFRELGLMEGKCLAHFTWRALRQLHLPTFCG